jgi:hypothetical protein
VLLQWRALFYALMASLVLHVAIVVSSSYQGKLFPEKLTGKRLVLELKPNAKARGSSKSEATAWMLTAATESKKNQPVCPGKAKCDLPQNFRSTGVKQGSAATLGASGEAGREFAEAPVINAADERSYRLALARKAGGLLEQGLYKTLGERPGKVGVMLAFSSSGAFVGADVVKTSGNANLDELARMLMQEAALQTSSPLYADGHPFTLLISLELGLD